MFHKKTLLSIFMLGIVICTAGAGTWAYFDSSVPVTGNTITAGTLGMNIINQPYNEPPQLIPMAAVGAKPGNVDVRLVPVTTYVRNTGSISGELYIQIVPDATDDGKLSKYLEIKATTGPFPGSGTMITLWKNGASTGPQDMGELKPFALDPVNNFIPIYYVYSFPETGNPQNDAQTGMFKFNVEYSVTQK